MTSLLGLRDEIRAGEARLHEPWPCWDGPVAQSPPIPILGAQRAFSLVSAGTFGFFGTTDKVRPPCRSKLEAKEIACGVLLVVLSRGSPRISVRRPGDEARRFPPKGRPARRTSSGCDS